jgi:hypothetical protein
MHAHSFPPLPFRLHRAHANGAATDRAADPRDDGPVIRLLVATGRVTPSVMLAPWLPVVVRPTAVQGGDPRSAPDAQGFS